MPTIGIKRDLLFDALGKKYSKFFFSCYKKSEVNFTNF